MTANRPLECHRLSRETRGHGVARVRSGLVGPGSGRSWAALGGDRGDRLGRGGLCGRVLGQSAGGRWLGWVLSARPDPNLVEAVREAVAANARQRDALGNLSWGCWR